MTITSGCDIVTVTMNNYALLIKSHTDAPDLEEYCVAPTKKEAVEMFHYWLKKYGWTKKEIDKNTEKIEQIGGVA